MDAIVLPVIGLLTKFLFCVSSSGEEMGMDGGFKLSEELLELSQNVRGWNMRDEYDDESDDRP